MHKSRIQFVEANIEVGQSHKGLSQSAKRFKAYLQSTSSSLQISFDADCSVESKLLECQNKFFSKKDLDGFSFSAYESLYQINKKLLNQNYLPVNYGGDHSLAISTVLSSLEANQNTHVIWIDAHADLNCAEKSLTGSFHGMPVYYLMQNPELRPESLQWMKKKLKPEQITYIGLRDLDLFEFELLNDLKIDYFTAAEVSRLGIQNIIHFLEFKNKKFKQIHLSFDIDSLDPSYGLCTGVPAAFGLRTQDVHEIFHWIKKTNQLVNFDLVEINPLLARYPNELENIYQISADLIQKILPEQIGDQYAFVTN